MLSLALVACAAATKPAVEDSKSCRQFFCQNLEEFGLEFCAPWEVVRKIFQAGAPGAPGGKQGQCCDTFKCVQDPSDPCGGKVCDVTTPEEALAKCNDLYPEDPIWTSLQPNAGAMYAVLKRPALGKAGRCCPEYVCRTNHNILCENLVAKTPCANASTCPLGHVAEIVRPADPENGRCCDEIRCVADPVALCDARDEGRVCPTPACDAVQEGYALQTTVTLYEADPYNGRCCPTRTCQNNLVNICLAERTRVGWVREEMCSDECEEAQIIEEEDLATGKCFPKWKCVPKPDHLCCGFNTTTCAAEPVPTSSCQSVETVPADEFVGPCCPMYKIVTDAQCVCNNATSNGADCPYGGSANTFQAQVCDVDFPGAFDVAVKPANADLGRCCDEFECVPTAEEQLRRLKKKKGRKVKSTTRRA